MEGVESLKVTSHVVYYKQSKQWADYLKDFGWKVFEDGGSRIFILPTMIGGLCKVQRPQDINESFLSDLDLLCKENKVFFCKLEPNSGASEDLLFRYGFVKSNTPLSPSTSLYIDLIKDKKTLRANLSRSGKYGVNRAEREGCEVKVFQSPSDDLLNKYRKILKSTEARRNFVSLNYKELVSLRNHFGDRSYLFLSYNREGICTGGKFFLGHMNTAAYVTGGATSLGLKGRSGYKLMWDAILYLKDEGYKTLDLEGCYDPRFPKFTRKWRGFTEFKNKFGPFIIEYPGAYVKVFSRILRPLAKYL